MELNKIAKKSIAIFSFLLLILSLNISTNVSATLVKNDEYGVAYDEFDDATNITYENCSPPVNGTIKLDFTETNFIYDLNTKRDKINAYEMTESFIKGLEGTLSKFLNPDLFLISANAYEIVDGDDLDDIAEEKDSRTLKTEAKLGNQEEPLWPMILFRFEIDHDKDIIDELNLTWISGDYVAGSNIEKISMYAWSYGDLIPYWNPVISATPEVLNGTNGYLTKKVGLTNFISDEGIIDLLIVGKPRDVKYVNAKLYTDYVMAKITIKEGYLSDGWIKSKLIEPTTIYGWERVFWSGSRPSADSYIKIKVLDQSGIEIPEEDLEGNSDGFSYSPIDISLLDSVKYPKIMLNALLHSGDIGFTPSLNSWGVLWQTKVGFYDSFTFDFRIDESYGVELDSGEIQISEFYSDWPIFGKNPGNTRSYVGTKATVGKNETYWYTTKLSDIGGGFRSPVVSNGRVYVASSNDKIYAFNLTTAIPDNEQSSIDESEAKYKVDTSVAVAGDLVFLATCNVSNSKSNKIHALNRKNLKDEIWSYPQKDKNFSNTICFSSAPTIANGRVFVTSWSGLFGNNPIISYLYNRLDNLLNLFGSSLGLNNKLFAIDINSGGLIWKDPANLPASSFTTPAVSNGLVFVGCENIEGPSLFAFDENSGEEVWNASIGMIGRSSPVVADGKVFVLSREQSSIFTFTGNDKVFTLDAETGEEIWNVTIGNNTSVFGNMLKVYGTDNSIATLAPASTPAVYNDNLFVMSPNGILYAFNIDTGEEKWSFDAAAEISGIDLTPYFSASPVVVDDIVYITASESFLSENSFIFALNNLKDGEMEWNYEILDPDYAEWVTQYHFIFASPVVTDGLVLISERRMDTNTGTYLGRVQAIGEYEKNLVGKVYSVPIHVQAKKWWNQFNATSNNTEESNTITFSILDENGVVLKSGLDGDDNNISDIGVNVIQLYAELNIVNVSEEPYPVLDNWGITWTQEDKKPEFINGSFRAGEGQGGWVNLDLEECSIEVKDIGVGDITSGIDTTSGKYKLEYMEGGSPVSNWFNAECDGDSGVTRIRAKISEDLKDVDITDLKNITFSIKDLAGNENTSDTITFKIDTGKPSSSIKNADEFLSKYNEPVTIEGEGTDDNSGIVNMGLYYRPLASTEWIRYRPDDPPYVWLFENTSDYYEFCTIATDKAGNQEITPDDGDMSFLFDMIEPEPIFDDKVYSFDILPVFSDVTFEDDYELESVDYRLHFRGENEWTNIATGLNDKTYSEEWSLSQDDWDIMEEDMIYYMYFRITDFGGNEYITSSVAEALKLTKDLTPNVSEDVALGLSDFEEGGWDDSFVITAIIPSGIDVDYVNLEYSYSSDNSEWSKWKQYGSDLIEAPFDWEFKAKDGSGYYRFKTTIYDTEGNFVESPVKSVNVTLFPTTLILLLIIFIIALFYLEFQFLLLRK